MIQLRVGSDEDDRKDFRIETALAEYLELPGAGNELRLTLASYALSCERYVAPGKSDVAVSVEVVWPPGVSPAPGTYPWAGRAAHAGTPDAPERAYAVPTARSDGRSHLLPPGGSITLDALDLTPQGTLSGILDFAFPGDREREATAVRGSFRAVFCRVAPKPR